MDRRAFELPTPAFSGLAYQRLFQFRGATRRRKSTDRHSWIGQLWVSFLHPLFTSPIEPSQRLSGRDGRCSRYFPSVGARRRHHRPKGSYKPEHSKDTGQLQWRLSSKDRKRSTCKNPRLGRSNHDLANELYLGACRYGEYGGFGKFHGLVMLVPQLSGPAPERRPASFRNRRSPSTERPTPAWAPI